MIEDRMEREIEYIEEEYAAGRISNAEMHRQIRDVQRDYAAAAHEAAQEAYDAELERW